MDQLPMTSAQRPSGCRQQTQEPALSVAVGLATRISPSPLLSYKPLWKQVFH